MKKFFHHQVMKVALSSQKGREFGLFLLFIAGAARQTLD